MAAAVARIYQRRHTISGLRRVKAAKLLSHFTACFEPIAEHTARRLEGERAAAAAVCDAAGKADSKAAVNGAASIAAAARNGSAADSNAADNFEAGGSTAINGAAANGTANVPSALALTYNAPCAAGPLAL